MGKFRNKAFLLMEEKQISTEDMAKACLRYMSEEDIEDMLWSDLNIDLSDNNEEDEENE